MQSMKKSTLVVLYSIILVTVVGLLVWVWPLIFAPVNSGILKGDESALDISIQDELSLLLLVTEEHYGDEKSVDQVFSSDKLPNWFLDTFEKITPAGQNRWRMALDRLNRKDRVYQMSPELIKKKFSDLPGNSKAFKLVKGDNRGSRIFIKIDGVSALY
jgi:hypothetical protein